MLVWISQQPLGSRLPDAASTAHRLCMVSGHVARGYVNLSTVLDMDASACGGCCLGKDRRGQAHLGCCKPNNSLTTVTCLSEPLSSPEASSTIHDTLLICIAQSCQGHSLQELKSSASHLSPCSVCQHHLSWQGNP